MVGKRKKKVVEVVLLLLEWWRRWRRRRWGNWWKKWWWKWRESGDLAGQRRRLTAVMLPFRWPADGNKERRKEIMRERERKELYIKGIRLL